jgi:hypothetical protein
MSGFGVANAAGRPVPVPCGTVNFRGSQALSR